MAGTRVGFKAAKAPMNAQALRRTLVQGEPPVLRAKLEDPTSQPEQGLRLEPSAKEEVSVLLRFPAKRPGVVPERPGVVKRLDPEHGAHAGARTAGAREPRR